MDFAHRRYDGRATPVTQPSKPSTHGTYIPPPMRKYVPVNPRNNTCEKSPAAPEQPLERSCGSPQQGSTKNLSEKKMARLKKYGKKPDLTPESVRASLKKKYEKDPKRYQRIYFSVFPKPVDTSRYEAEIAKLSRFRDEMSLQRIASLHCKIHRLQQRHARRLERSSEIVLEHIRRRVTRWEELHKGPVGKSSSLPSTCSFSSLSSTSASTQTSFPEADVLSCSTSSRSSLSLDVSIEQTDVSTQTETVPLLDPTLELRHQIEILEVAKDQLEEQKEQLEERLREQLRKAEEQLSKVEEDKQQLIHELQQTRFELCVLQDEKEDRLAKKKKSPLSFLRKKN